MSAAWPVNVPSLSPVEVVVPEADPDAVDPDAVDPDPVDPDPDDPLDVDPAAEPVDVLPAVFLVVAALAAGATASSEVR